jgi:hypothetical protein
MGECVPPRRDLNYASRPLGAGCSANRLELCLLTQVRRAAVAIRRVWKLVVGHGHGGEPDTADGGQCTCRVYRPLVAEPPTALAIPGAAFADRLSADVMVVGSGRRASVRRTPLGRRDDELANAAEAAPVADAIA